MKRENSFISPKSELTIEERDLPINNPKIERLKELNRIYFGGKGKYYNSSSKPWTGQECPPDHDIQYECTCELKSRHGEWIERFTFYEKDTSEEIERKIKAIKYYEMV